MESRTTTKRRQAIYLPFFYFKLHGNRIGEQYDDFETKTFNTPINQLTEAEDPSNKNKRKVFIIDHYTISLEPVKFYSSRQGCEIQWHA